MPEANEGFIVEQPKPVSTFGALKKDLGDLGHPTQPIVVAGQEVGFVFKERQSIPGTVRVYRGLTEPDAQSVLNQVSYVARDVDDDNKPTLHTDLVPAAEELANNPTYENLRRTAQLITERASARTARIVGEELERTEESVLRGDCVRSSLLGFLVERGGGQLDAGIAPYLSASYDPEQALGYSSRGVLLVLNLSPDRLQDFTDNSNGEVGIKARIKPEEIMAVIDTAVGKGHVAEAIQQVDLSIGWTKEDEETAKTERVKVLEQQRNWDANQLKIDKELLQYQLAARLAEKYPKLGLTNAKLAQLVEKTGKDVFTLAKETVFDDFATRLRLIGRPIESSGLTYESKRHGKLPIERDSVTVEMLESLEPFVERREQLDLPDFARQLGLPDGTDQSVVRSEIGRTLEKARMVGLISADFRTSPARIGRLVQQMSQVVPA